MTAAQLNKTLLFILLITSSVYAVEPAMLLAEKRYKDALVQYEEQVSICSKNDNKVLSITIFKDIKLTEKEWGIALLHLRLKALNSCTFQTKSNFTFAINNYITTSKHYKKEVSKTSLQEVNMLFSMSWSDLETEVKYLKIDKDIRAKLEKIPELKQPFEPIYTLDKIKESDLLLLSKK